MCSLNWSNLALLVLHHLKLIALICDTLEYSDITFRTSVFSLTYVGIQSTLKRRLFRLSFLNPGSNGFEPSLSP